MPGPEVWTWLNYEKKMQTVDSAEAVAMMKKGAVFLDVRFEPDYEKWSVPARTPPTSQAACSPVAPAGIQEEKRRLCVAGGGGDSE